MFLLECVFFLEYALFRSSALYLRQAFILYPFYLQELMSKGNSKMEEIVALCKRRGFIFHSSEIYGGINGFFDYGPLGVELRKNIKDAWWEDMVRRRDLSLIHI